MAGKAVISLSTGMEDPEKVTVAFLVAVGAAESGRPTLLSQPQLPPRLGLPVAEGAGTLRTGRGTAWGGDLRPFGPPGRVHTVCARQVIVLYVRIDSK